MQFTYDFGAVLLIAHSHPCAVYVCQKPSLAFPQEKKTG